MNIKKLEAFIMVVEKRSFSEAASAINSSQPAVSLKVKSLGEELGIELLDRGLSGTHPTAAGTLVYHASKEMIRTWNKLHDDLLRYQDTLTGSLTIGASTIPGTYLLPTWIKRFRTLFPMVDVKIEIGDSQEMLEKLTNRQIDLAIVGLCQESSSLTFRQIASDSLVLITSNNHQLAKLNQTDFTEIKQYDFVIREEGSGTRKEMEEYLTEQGLTLSDLNNVLLIGSTESVIAAVEADIGISFISKLAAIPAAKANRVRMIEYFPPYQRSFYLTNLIDAENRPIIEEFINLFKG
ncbi:selenium metabolism-associated LysR family transcriptional regulator [Pseudoneobacillus sp. C159]